jgi:hypothetical protein
MVALDVEHPPAAGTALAVVISEVSPAVFVMIMTSADTVPMPILPETPFERPGIGRLLSSGP